MATTTNITGYLYKSDGTKLTSGNLIVSLSQDFISIEGHKVAPFIKTSALSGTTGLIDFDLYATSNNVNGSSFGQPYPTGVVYTFEFDPEPSNQSIALVRKDGYWRAMFDIPHVSDTVADNAIGLGSLVPATSTQATFNPSYASSSDARMLTQPQKDTLTSGPSSNADDLHSHGAVSNTQVSLAASVSAPSPTEGFSYIYMTITGTSPNKEVRVIGQLEDGSEFIIGTAVL